MSRPIYNVKHASSVYGISERRIRYLAQLRGIGTKVGGSLIFTGGDIKRLKPGPNGYPKGRPRKVFDKRASLAKVVNQSDGSMITRRIIVNNEV